MTMYDMSRVTANGYCDYEKDEKTLRAERMAARKALNAQRTADAKAGCSQIRPAQFNKQAIPKKTAGMQYRFFFISIYLLFRLPCPRYSP